MRPQVGQVVNNKYRLLRLIGDGGMGTVYEARHEVLGTSVALKFLHSELAKRSGLVQRFLQEARVSAQIVSPHVVRVTDVDQTPNGAFIVMEYIEGKTLQSLYEELYRAGVQLPQADAIEYAMQMLEGVEAAHRAGVVHRDLKPDNVMITLDSKGRPLIKLLDFGIAKLRASPEFDRGLTRPGVIMGTPEYMAPEQCMSADTVDARADIFALGVMIFEMLGGRRPVGGEDPHQIAAAYVSHQIAQLSDLAPEVPAPLADAVHRAIAPMPADRWSSVSELRDAMQPYAAPPRPPTALPPGPSFIGDSGRGSRVSSMGNHSTNPAPPPSMSEPPPVGNPDLPHPPGFPKPLQASSSSVSAAAAGPSRTPTPAPLAAVIPDTRSVMPISVGNGTSPLGPLHAGGSGAYAATTAQPQQSGGTGLAEPLAPLVATEAAAGMFGVEGAAAKPFNISGPTSRVSLGTGGPPIVKAPVAATKRGGMLSSLPVILLLAAGVSAAVVGGVYLAHDQAKTDDHEEPTPPPPTTVMADPPVDTSQAIASPNPTAPTQTRPLRPGVLPPQSGTSVPFKPGPGLKPSPSAQPQPTSEPLFPFPVLLPSSLPIDLPFLPSRHDDPPAPSTKPGQRPQQPPQQPSQQPPRGGDRMIHGLEQLNSYDHAPHVRHASSSGRPLHVRHRAARVMMEGPPYPPPPPPFGPFDLEGRRLW